MSYGAVVYMTETRDVTVLKRWRKSGLIAPVIVISRLSAVSVRVAFLNAGADDWLPLPAAAEEVSARLRAILRRNYSLSDVVLRYDELVFDPTIRTVTYQGSQVKLTPKEMTILELFLLNHRRLLTRQYLEDHLSTWQRDINSNIIEVHISNLRRKLGGNIIQTVRGQGYRLREP
ncbi:response regulator transcription factor [Salmonella enterica]|uniref:Response regulator transcription factor n=1 Tax=Salmonella enterica TaxID=28901 RepID=A0A5Z3BRU5_SALER|nr:response regulator transcription factor [Salmonella enterica]ECK3539584.1 response regulator transcription factor [Salmonella enterica]ECL6067869.1 response regulator transcription factor [Salmonella enterica]ECL6624649.1 response regulator transcription factor [Salmonella enterica]ECO7491281.1 response regulator transcription factor [Salmonella enterica]